MFSHRTSAGASWRRFVLVGGLAAALVLVPGVAAGDEGDQPLGSGTGIAEQLEGGEAGTADQETPAPPPFALPPELEEAFAQFAEQAGISQECVDEVTASLEQIAHGLTTPPVPPEQVLEDLEAALGGLTNPTPEALQELLAGFQEELDPANDDVALGLERLAAALQSEMCRPATEPATTTQPAATSSSHAPARTAPAPTPSPAPAPQPAAYPGYAPTGAESDADATTPLAAGGALLLIGAGGAIWAGRRWRAARDAG